MTIFTCAHCRSEHDTWLVCPECGQPVMLNDNEHDSEADQLSRAVSDLQDEYARAG